MTIPCEIAVKCLLPSVRAIIAKTLTSKYNLKQTEVAKRLGISQPAISLYEKKMRGKALNVEDDPELLKLIENLAGFISRDDLSRESFIQSFCEICRTARSKGLLCKLHKTLDSKISTEGCKLCINMDSLRCF